MVLPAGSAAALLPAGLAPAALGGTPVQVVQQLPGAQVQAGTAILQVQPPPPPPPSGPGSVGSVEGQASSQGQVNSLPQAFEKKLRRLEKNRESARGGCVGGWVVV